MGEVFRSAPAEFREGLREIDDEDVPDRGILIVAPNGVIRCANPRMAEMLQMDLDELVGGDYRACVADRLRGGDNSQEESPEPAISDQARDEVIIVNNGSGERYIHRYSAPLYGADGELNGRAEVYSDISQRRRLEQLVLERHLKLALRNEELRRAQDTLIRTVKLATLGEMAAGVAHHLNNCLGVILGNVQLMLGRDIDEGLRQKLRMCELAARDGAETVRRIRSLSWPDQSAPSVPVDLNDIVREAAQLARAGGWPEPDSDASEVKLTIDTNPVPSVIGCAPELREALANIVLNAIQAVSSGGEVRVSTGVEDGFVRVCVEDTGVGMTEEVKSRIFSPFYTTRGPEGTGLGMSIVDAVITKHDGSVDIDSEPGKGTRVTIRLPAEAGCPVQVPDRVEALRPLGPRAEASENT